MDALRILERSETFPPDISKRLNSLRHVRNSAVYAPEKLKTGELAARKEISSILNQLKKSEYSALIMISINLSINRSNNGLRQLRAGYL